MRTLALTLALAGVLAAAPPPNTAGVGAPVIQARFKIPHHPSFDLPVRAFQLVQCLQVPGFNQFTGSADQLATNLCLRLREEDGWRGDDGDRGRGDRDGWHDGGLAELRRELLASGGVLTLTVTYPGNGVTTVLQASSLTPKAPGDADCLDWDADGFCFSVGSLAFTPAFDLPTDPSGTDPAQLVGPQSNYDIAFSDPLASAQTPPNNGVFDDYPDFTMEGATIPWDGSSTPPLNGLFFAERPWGGDTQLFAYLAGELGDPSDFTPAPPVTVISTPNRNGFSDPAVIQNATLGKIVLHVTDHGSARETVWLAAPGPLW